MVTDLRSWIWVRGHESSIQVFPLGLWNLSLRSLGLNPGSWVPSPESWVPVHSIIIKKWDKNYYKVWQKVITMCDSYWKSERHYKVRLKVIIKFDSYYKVWQEVITICERYYKVWHLLQSEAWHICWKKLSYWYLELLASLAKTIYS